ncbi:hypothetical protein NQ315_016669 [Exocentrus adspersus]|uniref:Uncharacterized protein n=1 Tax=Exocentrus adspersus TaxID=1586481 RepID=A0AAV8VNK5_9CUCU|nr:hypothetical protein NQ315_016669 [Exocentrus adspersus]
MAGLALRRLTKWIPPPQMKFVHLEELEVLVPPVFISEFYEGLQTSAPAHTHPVPHLEPLEVDETSSSEVPLTRMTRSSAYACTSTSHVERMASRLSTKKDGP